MGGHLRAALAVLLAAAGLVAGGPTSAASAQTSGPESFTGFLVVAGVSGRRVSWPVTSGPAAFSRGRQDRRAATSAR